MVRVGSARSNENGGITGGQAGDQTGREVSIQEWYLHKKGWSVIRAKDSGVRELIAHNMESICANDKIGYCQDHRTSMTALAAAYGYDASKITKPCEVDCSEAVRVCCLYAGIKVGTFNTASQVAVLKATGKFDVLQDDKYCTSADYLRRGDILVTRTKGHTVVVLDNGAKAPAEQLKAGWVHDEHGWWYRRADGSYPRMEWQLINHHWYLFGGSGYMITGWAQWDGCKTGAGDWYYLEESGEYAGACWHEVPGGSGALERWYVD